MGVCQKIKKDSWAIHSPGVSAAAVCEADENMFTYSVRVAPLRA